MGKKPTGGNGGITVDGSGASANFSQPSNPSEPSNQSVARNESHKGWVAVPLISVVEKTLPDGTVEVIKTTYHVGAEEHTIGSSVGVTVGAAHKDWSAEIGEKMKQMRPVQYIGIGMIVFSAAGLFWLPLRTILGGGKQFPIAIGVVGGILVLLPQVMVGNERLVIIIASIGILIYWLSIRLTRKEAEADMKTALKGGE